MNAALYTVARYLVTFGAGWLTQHGWSVASADGPTLDAVTQIVVGGIGLAVPAAIGVLTGTVKWMVGRLQSHHKAALLDGAAAVPGVTKIVATPQLAAATDSDKVRAS